MRRQKLSWKMYIIPIQRKRLAEMLNDKNCYCKVIKRVIQSSNYRDSWSDHINSAWEYLWDDNIFVEISISCIRNAQNYTHTLFFTRRVVQSLEKEIVARCDMGSWRFITIMEIIYLRQRMSFGRSRDARIIDIERQSLHDFLIDAKSFWKVAKLHRAI